MGVIAAQLGHADTRMTEKHYAHLAPSYVADTVRAALPPLGVVESCASHQKGNQHERREGLVRSGLGGFGLVLLPLVIRLLRTITRDREPARPGAYLVYKPRRGLNDISVLSKSSYGRSVSRNRASQSGECRCRPTMWDGDG
jgi:hypothetical protein